MGFPYFPLGLKGTIRLKTDLSPTRAASRAVAEIERMLDEAAASTVETEGSDVTFTARMFRGVGNWNILAQFGSGRVRVEPDFSDLVVRYELSTTRLFLVVTGMMGVLTWIAIPGANSFDTWLGEVRILVPLGWGWVFGMNYLIGMIRFRLWLRRGLFKALCADTRAATV